jgi:hypothetical protein
VLEVVPADDDELLDIIEEGQEVVPTDDDEPLDVIEEVQEEAPADNDEPLDIILVVEPAQTEGARPLERPGNSLNSPAPSDIAYAPIPPKVARLKAHERHLYTFKLNLCVWKNWWDMKAPGWYPTMSFCILHVTDKRILIEEYAGGKAEGAAAVGILVAMVAWAGEGNPTGSSLTAAFGIPDGLRRRKNKRGKWVEVLHTEIASVGWADGGTSDKAGIFNLKKSMVKVDFKTRGVGPLVFGAQAGQSGMFTVSNISKEFIEVMGQFLHS